MNGKVKMYNEQKGYGFILGDDGYDYFIHISSIKNAEPIYRGAGVSFTPSVNSKGRVAVNVLVAPFTTSRPEFIRCGNMQIRLSNIKSFTLVDKNKKREERRNSEDSLWEYAAVGAGVLMGVMDYIAGIGIDIPESNGGRSEDYLEITTYQKDRYVFKRSEASFDIYEKYNELVSYLG